MLLVMPPAEVTVAVSPARVTVWTRDSAVSNRMHPDGFLSGTTRNSIGALTVEEGGADACIPGGCCVEHPARTAAYKAEVHNTPVKFRIVFTFGQRRRNNGLSSNSIWKPPTDLPVVDGIEIIWHRAAQVVKSRAVAIPLRGGANRGPEMRPETTWK